MAAMPTRVAANVQALAANAVAQRADWALDLLSPATAVSKALALAATADRPIVIADTQDNPGAGGDSNTTGMLHALLQAGAGTRFPGRRGAGTAARRRRGRRRTCGRRRRHAGAAVGPQRAQLRWPLHRRAGAAAVAPSPR